MKLQLVPPRQGALWVRQGFTVFVKQPMGFAGLFATFLFVVFALTLLPVVGPLLLLALLPLGSLGFMVATRSALEGRFPLPRAFIAPLRAGRAQLLAIVKLGLIYAAATWCILALSDWIDGGALDALMEAQASGTSSPDVMAAKLADPRLEAGVLLRFGLLGLLSVPFWHAPALVHWGCQSGRQGALLQHRRVLAQQGRVRRLQPDLARRVPAVRAARQSRVRPDRPRAVRAVRRDAGLADLLDGVLRVALLHLRRLLRARRRRPGDT